MNNLHSATQDSLWSTAPKAVLFPVIIVAGMTISGCAERSAPTHLAAADSVQAVKGPSGNIQMASAAGKYLAGRFARRNRDFNNAARLLTDALQIDKKNRRIRRQAFFAMVASGRFDEAAKLARLIVKTNKGAKSQ